MGQFKRLVAGMLAMVGCGCCCCGPEGTGDGPVTRAVEQEMAPMQVAGQWSVEAIEFEHVRTDAPTECRAPVSIAFEPGESEIAGTESGSVTGFAGVNRFFGSYTLEDDRLSFSPLGSTRMAGPPELMEFEGTLFRLLGGAERVVGQDGGVVIECAAGSIELVAAEPEELPEK